jgi:Ca2+-transporting ATPase
MSTPNAPPLPVAQDEVARNASPPSSQRPGLTEREAALRLSADGRNELRRGAGRPVLRAIGHQLTDTMIVVLLLAAALTAAVGDATDTAVILAVIVLNTTLGAVQEVRSASALAALADLTAPQATVVRDGLEREVASACVVRGDLIRLAAGDIVPADAVLATQTAVQVDESMLTGESVAVDKSAGETVYAGTVVTRGHGDAVVAATAGRTAIGGIAQSLAKRAAPRTPVQRQLTVLGRRLALAVAVAAVVVAAINLADGRGLETSVVLAISLAVAAIPESLPAVVSLALSLAARRLSAAGVLTRRLPAVEALGSITVIAADKTGTLTEGRMSVERVWTPTGSAEQRRDLLVAGLLCNDACMTTDGSPARRDDPVEIALVEAAGRDGLDVAAVRAAHPRVAEVPFEAASARMTTTHRGPDEVEFSICKGSAERILLGLPGADDAEAAADDLASRGYRVLAVTTCAGGSTRITGLIAFRDPPRENARDVIDAFRAAGVRPIMITGDHRSTAGAIASAVGIDVDHRSLFARVLPDEKRSIVEGLRAGGEVVAMTGDGVNDAPALHAADIGVAMGSQATEVARQSADLVLTGDDLAAMIPAIAEGRRAYDNLRRFLHYALSGGMAEVLVMLFGPLLGFVVPLQAGQILWVNLLTHGLPGVAVGNEPADADVLRRPPRRPDDQLLDRRTAQRVAALATVVAASCLTAGAYARHIGRPWQSTIFVALTLAQLAVVMCLRPRGTRWRDNLFLPAAVALNLALIVAAVAWAPLRELLHTQSLSPADLTVCVVASILPGVVAALQVRHRRS